jgi:hypothetical protein
MISYEEVRKPTFSLEVRKPKVSEVHDVALIGTIATPAEDAPRTLGNNAVLQSPPTISANNAEASAAESDPRTADSLTPPRERKARKARSHRQQRYAGWRQRYDMGPTLGFAREERFARGGYAMYPATPRRVFGRPSGWGW